MCFLFFFIPAERSLTIFALYIHLFTFLIMSLEFLPLYDFWAFRTFYIKSRTFILHMLDCIFDYFRVFPWFFAIFDWAVVNFLLFKEEFVSKRRLNKYLTHFTVQACFITIILPLFQLPPADETFTSWTFIRSSWYKLANHAIQSQSYQLLFVILHISHHMFSIFLTANQR